MNDTNTSHDSSTSGGRSLVWVDRPPPDGLEIPDGIELTNDVNLADGAVIGADDHWDAAACVKLPKLKVVARAGIGYDNVDVSSCASVGVAACNAPDAPTVSTAEHALALILAVAKRLKPAERSLRKRAEHYRATHQALELDTTTLGLVGFGRIGSRVGRYGAALGMKVLAHDPYVDVASLSPELGGAVTFVDLEELWRCSDVISLHAPATPATHHLVDADTLAMMRKGVIIVNCARGSLIDHTALQSALETGQVAAAGLDVTEPEPLPADHPLLAHDDVIITPHIASSTRVGVLRLIGMALSEAAVWLKGGTPEHLLDPAAADPGVDRRYRDPLP